MNYSDYTMEEFSLPIYKEVSQQLLRLAKDEDTKRKMKRYII